jgi:uncharacterized membrane protein
MTFFQYLKLYGFTLAAFFLIDMVWLGLVAKSFYRKHLGFLMRPTVNWIAALLFYCAFIVGILIFAVIPARQAGSIMKAVLLGALFGFFTYATYDMTNLATLKDWPMVVVVVDILWGMVLSGSVATLGYVAGGWV